MAASAVNDAGTRTDLTTLSRNDAVAGLTLAGAGAKPDSAKSLVKLTGAMPPNSDALTTLPKSGASTATGACGSCIPWPPNSVSTGVPTVSVAPPAPNSGGRTPASEKPSRLSRLPGTWATSTTASTTALSKT